ncbi:MAG: TnpV protein [Ruminococcus bromii]|nr:TnpV protein [Ruminococcus bromii]
MEITYTMQGDYLLPNLTLPEQDSRTIGLWGQQHLRYIKRNRPILYTNLLTKCKLNEYLTDVDEQAQKMYNELVRSFAKKEGCTELLKSTNQMLWVRKMNNATQRAREVVNEEIIYN